MIQVWTPLSKKESNGKDIFATAIQGEHCFDEQDLSTIHIEEQSLVEHSPVLPLSQDDFLAVICDK